MYIQKGGEGRMKNDGIFIRLDSRDREILNELKTKYAINISQLFRNTIKDFHKMISENNKNKKK